MKKLTSVEKFQAYVGQTSPFPPSMEVAYGRGSYLFDVHGKHYLDFISGFSVTNVGHCDARVSEAVAEQARAYAHTVVYGEHVQRPQVDLAEAIVEVAPAGLDCVYFLTTGAEANDAALKMASKQTRRSRFVAFDHAYHGDTVGALSCFGSSHFREQFPGLKADVTFLPFGDLAALDAIDDSMAAVLVEPVQGEGGMIPPPEGFLEALRERTRDVGALLIFDEVQTGFGRTGSWFAAETYGVTPDVITMAKGMGMGYPLAGVLAGRQMLYDFAAVPAFSHITTFGGHPVSCAAGLAGMRIIQDDNLLQNCRDLGAFLLESLKALQGRYGTLISDVRGVGLMIGVEMAEVALAREVVEEARRQGLILETTLLRETTIRFSPPLSVVKAECVEALEIFERVLGGLRAQP